MKIPNENRLKNRMKLTSMSVSIKAEPSRYNTVENPKP